MSKDEIAIEKEIQDKGLNAPRLNPDLIHSKILAVQYYLFPGTVCTICCITLQNGFTVIGKSAPVDPNNYDKELGERIAFNEAKDQIWQLEGYLLKEKLNTKD